MGTLSSRDRIGQIAERWFLSEPLLFSIWTTHNIVIEPGIRTIRVRRGRVEYNPEFIKSLDEEQLDAVLRFEAMRIVLKHPYLRQKENRELTYLASNVTIQEYLKTGLPFPYAQELFGTNEFDRQYFEFYYYKLQTQAQQISSDAQAQAQEGQARTEDPGTGQAESPENKESETENSESGKENANDLENTTTYADHRETGRENTQDWDRDELTGERINEKITMAQASNQWGTISGDVQELILATLVPKIDYRAVLRHFRASILSVNRVLTRMKPSRRYGFLYMGSRRDFSTRLLFAVDVSGSVSSEDLERGFSVINRFFKYGLESIDVVCFDTEIKGKVLTLKKACREIRVTGRGGTNFDPVMTYIDKHRQYDGLVVFTDGFAPVPQKPANRKTRILWLFNTESNWNQMQKALLPIGRSAFLN